MNQLEEQDQIDEGIFERGQQSKEQTKKNGKNVNHVTAWNLKIIFSIFEMFS